MLDDLMVAVGEAIGFSGHWPRSATRNAALLQNGFEDLVTDQPQAPAMGRRSISRSARRAAAARVGAFRRLWQLRLPLTAVIVPAMIGLLIGLIFMTPHRLSGASFDDVRHGLAEFRSADGILSATLEVSERKVRLGDVVVDGAAYNGEYAGPVLRVHPGDVMRIKLVNHLSEPTNLHFHGIDTSPLGNSDNMHIVVQPGASFDYEVRIPKTQAPGLYWYHDHTHGLTEKHVMAGLSGALIVEGFAEQFPELAGIQERLFVLKDYSIDDSNDPNVVANLHEYIQSINGQTFTTTNLRPGETQLWRFTNQSANLYFHISLKGHRFRIIGDDGAAATKETETDVLNIAPASRLEVLVDGGPPGVYDLVSENVLTGAGAELSRNRVLGRVTIEGQIAESVARIVAFPASLDLRSRDIDANRTVEFSQDTDAERFFVNDRLYDHARIDIRVPLGNIEEWTIRNKSDDMHVFHIHQVSFQVTEINGEPQPFAGHVDVVRIPERGEVKIRMAFTDPLILGSFMYHCHVLKHEDKGMMANIEIYDPKENVRGHIAHSH
jgi:suppressor of ftsI